MGYILPITHIQSMQYINRSVLNKLEPIKLLPTHNLRVQPLKNETPPYVKQSIKREKNGHHRVNNAEVLADITGKGHFINEYI